MWCPAFSYQVYLLDADIPRRTAPAATKAAPPTMAIPSNPSRIKVQEIGSNASLVPNRLIHTSQNILININEASSEAGILLSLFNFLLLLMNL